MTVKTRKKNELMTVLKNSDKQEPSNVVASCGSGVLAQRGEKFYFTGVKAGRKHLSKKKVKNYWAKNTSFKIFGVTFVLDKIYSPNAVNMAGNKDMELTANGNLSFSEGSIRIIASGHDFKGNHREFDLFKLTPKNIIPNNNVKIDYKAEIVDQSIINICNALDSLYNLDDSVDTYDMDFYQMKKKLLDNTKKYHVLDPPEDGPLMRLGKETTKTHERFLATLGKKKSSFSCTDADLEEQFNIVAKFIEKDGIANAKEFVEGLARFGILIQPSVYFSGKPLYDHIYGSKRTKIADGVREDALDFHDTIGDRVAQVLTRTDCGYSLGKRKNRKIAEHRTIEALYLSKIVADLKPELVDGINKRLSDYEKAEKGSRYSKVMLEEFGIPDFSKLKDYLEALEGTAKSKMNAVLDKLNSQKKVKPAKSILPENLTGHEVIINNQTLIVLSDDKTVIGRRIGFDLPGMGLVTKEVKESKIKLVHKKGKLENFMKFKHGEESSLCIELSDGNDTDFLLTHDISFVLLNTGTHYQVIDKRFYASNKQAGSIHGYITSDNADKEVDLPL